MEVAEPVGRGPCNSPSERKAWSSWLPPRPQAAAPAPAAPPIAVARGGAVGREARLAGNVPTPVRASSLRRRTAGGAAGGGGGPVAVRSPGGGDARPTPLRALAACAEAGGRVDVEAVVSAVGELEKKELPLQPGEFVTTRTLSLQQGDVECAWTLWDGEAARYGHDLVGCRLRVRGATVHKFSGGCRLTGCLGVDLCARVEQGA